MHLGEEPFMIGMLGSAYFAGWMLGSIMMSRIGDLYGRKLPFYISLVTSVLAYLWSLMTQSLHFQIFLLFVMGSTQAGKYSIAHVYIQEVTPGKFRVWAGTAA